MAQLGLKLYYLRTRERRLSQQEVADALQIRQATLSHLERGRSQPNHDVLGRICRYFDVTPTWLLDDERGVVPRPTERWSRRDALLTTGMWVELDPAGDLALADGGRLSPLPAGTPFYDEEAAALRRRATDAATAEAELARRAAEEAEDEAVIVAALEHELAQHPRRRRPTEVKRG